MTEAHVTHVEVAQLEQAALAAVIRTELRRSNWNPSSIAAAILAAPTLKYSAAVKPLTVDEYGDHDLLADTSKWVALPAAIGPLDGITHALTARINSQLPAADHITLTAHPKTVSAIERRLTRFLRTRR